MLANAMCNENDIRPPDDPIPDIGGVILGSWHLNALSFPNVSSAGPVAHSLSGGNRASFLHRSNTTNKLHTCFLVPWKIFHLKKTRKISVEPNSRLLFFQPPVLTGFYCFRPLGDPNVGGGNLPDTAENNGFEPNEAQYEPFGDKPTTICRSRWLSALNLKK